MNRLIIFVVTAQTRAKHGRHDIPSKEPRMGDYGEERSAEPGGDGGGGEGPPCGDMVPGCTIGVAYRTK